VVAALALFVPGHVTAQGPQQSVVGTVTEAGGTAPVDGAMVLLLDGEQTLARALTDARGRFALVVPRPGRYELRVDRIGYASTLSGAFDVPAGQTVQRPVATSVAPVVLAGLDVSATGRCHDRSTAAVAIVWDEVRKALEAATWTEDRELYRMGWVRWVRELAPDGRRVLDERRERRRRFTPSVFSAVDPDSLAVHGFVREVEGQEVFSAPDAHVLLSDAFLDGHCFGLEVHRVDGRERVGLTFEPLDDRRLPEVRGVLWLDAQTRLLETLEYEYVNLGRVAAVRGDDAHGSLRFRALPNGTWIVEEWNIRMPRLLEVQDVYGRTRRYDVTGYVEEGGSITSVTTSDGRQVDTDRAAVVGTVTDSIGAPAAGVRVTVAGTELGATTDSGGAFRIDELGEGTWMLETTDPRLGAYGHDGVHTEVVVRRDTESVVDVTLPSLREVAHEVCRARPDPETDGGALLGRVVTDDGRAVAGAEVRVTWTELRGATRRSVQGAGITTDAGGAFTLCGLPPGTALSATASTAEGAVGSVEAEISEATGVGSTIVTVVSEGAETTTSSDRALELRDDALAVWLRSVGFDRRRDHALLSLTDAGIAATGRDRLERILDDHPRLEPETLTSGQSVVWLGPAADVSGGERCWLDVYLNGSLVRYRFERVRRPGLDVTLMPSRISALEVFDGASSPVGTPDSCGALLLWVDEVRSEDDPSFVGSVFGRVPAAAPGGERARLTLLPDGREAMLDDEGRFDFGPVPAARYTVEARVPAWGTLCLPVEVRVGSNVELEITPTSVGEAAALGPARDGASPGVQAAASSGGAIIRCGPPPPR
jgi:hypothetical protein